MGKKVQMGPGLAKAGIVAIVLSVPVAAAIIANPSMYSAMGNVAAYVREIIPKYFSRLSAAPSQAQIGRDASAVCKVVYDDLNKTLNDYPGLLALTDPRCKDEAALERQR